MVAKYYEDFKTGEKHLTLGRTVTESDIVSFAALTSDWNPLHTDEEWCKKYSMFKRRIAHGALTLCLGIGLITRLGWFDGTVKAFLGLDKLRLTAPVFIGDTIRAEVEIMETRLSRKGEGIVKIRPVIYNQRNEKVGEFEMTLIIERKGEK